MEAETERYMSDINNSVYDSIYKRRSIRKYKSDMLPKEQIEKILDAAKTDSRGNFLSMVVRKRKRYSVK